MPQVKTNLTLAQINENVYRLKTMKNTTEFKIGRDFTKKEVENLIGSGKYNCSISGNN